MMQEITEALESTAPSSDQRYSEKPANASVRDIYAHRDYLMRFLTELDAEITVGELRAVLGGYE